MLSKEAVRNWLVLLVIFCGYGLLMKAGTHYWTAISIGMLLGIPILWVTDKAMKKIHDKRHKKIERGRKS